MITFYFFEKKLVKNFVFFCLQLSIILTIVNEPDVEVVIVTVKEGKVDVCSTDVDGNEKVDTGMLESGRSEI